jgi:hypothetical protein
MRRAIHSACCVWLLLLVVSLDVAWAEVVPCVGDCDGTGSDTISSLVTLVAIALGREPATACAQGLPSGASVDVALLVQAVNNALMGCPGVQSTATPTATVQPSKTPCPTGQHRACHSGSGRGGGYHTICSCVADPPPVCVTAWGTRIAAGSAVVLYDTLTVIAPDTCAAHGTTAFCDAHGVLDPVDATGYPTCTVLTERGGDD